MNILYIGDIMGEPGIEAVGRVLPDLKNERQIDLVIAQAENVTDGKGLSVGDYEKLQKLGIDFFTGGNWSTYRPEIHPYLEDMSKPIIRPANYPNDTPGRGWKYVKTREGEVLVVSLLGHIVGKDADKPSDNPLKVIDEILEQQKGKKLAAIVVNFHGDYSSEKRVIGYYLDGQVTAVIGDHWHVPTADSMVLPKGTAHITDVGMCGTLHSSLGVKLENVIPRWRDNVKNRNDLETTGPFQFNAVLIENDNQALTAHSVQQIQVLV